MSQHLVALPLYCLTWVQLLGSLPQTSHNQLLEDTNWVRIEDLLLLFFSLLPINFNWIKVQHLLDTVDTVVFKEFSKSVFGETKPVSIKSAPRKNQWWTSDRVIGDPVMRTRKEGSPGCSVLMERCQNTECITALSGCKRWPRQEPGGGGVFQCPRRCYFEAVHTFHGNNIPRWLKASRQEIMLPGTNIKWFWSVLRSTILRV